VFKELRLDLFQTVYDRMLADQRDTVALEGPMEIEGRFLTIGLHGSRMKDEANKDLGIVLVFEDLTELIKAQKVAAWQVARRWRTRLKPVDAHQLSAQRLRKAI
jgi:two-component system nitrogen regulation sensor histidine kinase NtrY